MPAGHDGEVNDDRFVWLLELCEGHGLTTKWVDLGPTLRARYRPRYRRIDLNHRLSLRQLVPALAHEFAHHHYRDTCSTTASERRAWEFAAEMLISAEQYSRAEQIVGSNVHAIAHELDCTPVIVEARRRMWRDQSARLPQSIESWGA